MAGQPAWWLMKNTLTPIGADPNRTDIPRDRGALSPDKMLPHQRERLDRMHAPPGAPPPPVHPDHAKHELFGGGRRPRRHSSDGQFEDEPPPFGVNVKYGRRRHSHDEVHKDHQDSPFARLGHTYRPPLATVNESTWRAGDVLPFTLDGGPARYDDHRPNVNASDWRVGDNQQPMSVILHGVDQVATPRSGAPSHQASPRAAAFNSQWRKSDAQPLSLGPDDPSPRRRGQVAVNNAVVNSQWRQGTDEPLQLVQQHDGPPMPRSRRPSQDDVNRSMWRDGDTQPFRMDGHEVERVMATGSLPASTWRGGDSQPFRIDGAAAQYVPPNAVINRGVAGGAEERVKNGARERALLEHQNEVLSKMCEAPPIGQLEQRFRKNERRF